MNLKKSNREGTGKVSNCKYCNTIIPFYKKYCNKTCYNNDKNVIMICKCCGVSKKIPKNKQNAIYCSIQCSNKNIDRKQSNNKAKQTLINKYGVDNPFDVKGYNNHSSKNVSKLSIKLKKSWQEKTPKEKLLISNKISQSLNARTNLDKTNTKIKREQTNIVTYGDKSSLGKNSSLRYKADMNNKYSFFNSLTKWLNDNDLELLDEYKGVKDSEGEIIYYSFKHTPTNTIFIDHVACGRRPIYRDPTKSIGTSLAEKEIQEFIKNNTTYTIICNNRKLVKGFEIDIYLPELKLAIEYNGIKWHSELNGKNKDYHLNKTLECEKQNISLIHIFEDEWKHKKEIIKSKILNALNVTSTKIYARKCEIREVNNPTKNNFLNDNHIQGEDKSKVKLGLYCNNELVSVMTFGNLRKITGNITIQGVYEMIRFTTKLNTNVVGGFTKLLSHFIKKHNPTKIISYADRRYSSGKLYLNNGFNFLHDTPPNYWYMKCYNKREHRFAYRKSELHNKLEKFQPNISEWENMKLNGYDRIWDCGSKKFELTPKY